jgi:hypothetical protein
VSLLAFVQSRFPSGRADGQNCTLSIIGLATVRNEVELPKATVRVFLADLVLEPNNTPLSECEWTFCAVRIPVAVKNGPRDDLEPESQCPR